MLTRRQFLKLFATTVAVTSALELVMQMPTGSGAANREIPILLYHRVGHTRGHLTVTPERFAADLAELAAAGYRTITLEQFEAFLQDRNVELPDKPVLITFDDGYRDNYEQAFPLLQRYNMQAAFFIITGMIGQPERLSGAQIREMAGAGMSFGSHTVSHRSLGDLPAPEIQQELAISKFDLEDLLGRPVRSIAYPKGSYNYDTIKLAEENGYVAGFTTLHGKSSKKTHPFALRRIPLFSFDGDIWTIMAKRGRAE